MKLAPAVGQEALTPRDRPRPAGRLAEGPVWHPRQLRHNAPTELRKEFSIETARIILGRHSAAITEVYADRDEEEAIEAITKVG